MSNFPNQNQGYGQAYAMPAEEMGFYPAAMAAAEERKAFIQKTYLHVAGALVLFAAALAGLVTLAPQELMLSLFGHGKFGFLLVLAAFIGASFLSGRLSQPDMPLATQYMGLGLYVAVEAVIFWPLLWVVGHKFGGDYSIVYQAAVLTVALAAGLTTAVFVTGKDFSFLAPIISIGCWGALGLIVISMFVPQITLGFWFSAAMVGLMSAAILYSASNVMNHYPTNAYVAAALYIFSAIVTLFYYIIRMLMSSRN